MNTLEILQQLADLLAEQVNELYQYFLCCIEPIGFAWFTMQGTKQIMQIYARNMSLVRTHQVSKVPGSPNTIQGNLGVPWTFCMFTKTR